MHHRNFSYFVHSLTCKYFRFRRCHVELYTIRAHFRRNRLPTFVICGFITNSCLEASLCRHFVIRLSIIMRSCRLVIILDKNRWKKCSGIFWHFTFWYQATWFTASPLWCTCIFVHHTDFRLNQLSYMLDNSFIESGVLKNIKVDVFLVHFPFFGKDNAEIVILHRFSAKIRRHHPRFRWRHVIFGWNILFISASCDAELVPLGIGESAFSDSYGSRRY